MQICMYACLYVRVFMYAWMQGCMSQCMPWLLWLCPCLHLVRDSIVPPSKARCRKLLIQSRLIHVHQWSFPPVTPSLKPEAWSLNRNCKTHEINSNRPSCNRNRNRKLRVYRNVQIHGGFDCWIQIFSKQPLHIEGPRRGPHEPRLKIGKILGNRRKQKVLVNSRTDFTSMHFS